MKLMTELKKQLEQLGDIRRVWLTTFNLDISFVETHILPAVLGVDSPRNRMDYETMQLALQDKGIDFRIFCDKRMLGAEQNKRTAIHIEPVAVRGLAEFTGQDPKNSLFHPKVIYLEDVNGQMILGAGSANLTVSGWGRNQEVMDFRAVSGNEQYQQIKKFFLSIDSSLKMPVRRRFWGDDEDWSFIHSFGKDNLLNYLWDNGEISHLTVWSPYLSSDLPVFIKKLESYFEMSQLTVSLVTDRIEARYIRTGWSESLAFLLKSGRLKFFENPAEKHDCTEMTHAKIWLSHGLARSVIAIGSWNFTTPGCASLAGNLEDDGNSSWSNVEAGIVHYRESKPKIVGAAYTPTADDFASSEILEEDAIQPPELLPFDLTVTFDWQQSKYQVKGVWHDGGIHDGYNLNLPGLEVPLQLQWSARKRAGKHVLIGPAIPSVEGEALLTDHFYRVEYKGAGVYQGLIIEQRADYRRAQSYASLQELLNSYVSEVDPETNDSVGLRQCLRDRDEIDQEWLTPELPVQEVSVSYFRLFYAIKEYKKRLESLALLIEEQCAVELQKWLFVYPGCLQELAEKVRDHIQHTDAPGFNWFLANEVNALGVFSQKLYRKLYRELNNSKGFGDPSFKIDPHKWKSLDIPVPELPTGDGRREAYVELISKESGYVA